MEKERSREAKRNGARINAAQPAASETPAAEKGSGVRYASDALFKEAHRKTNKVHAGLFRRLAE
jgi:hypothetical protein